MRVLKNAAKTRKVPAKEILAAFSVIEKAKIDPSGFLETLGGTESPGRTWMLIFTAEVKEIRNFLLLLFCFRSYFISFRFLSFLILIPNGGVVFQKGLEQGKYFPITAVQRFDAAVSSLTHTVLYFCVNNAYIERRYI